MAEAAMKPTKDSQNGTQVSNQKHSIELIKTIECLATEGCGPCDITGMTSLPDGRMILSDVNNGQLRLLNLEYDVIDIADVPNIWGVETVSENKVCVTRQDQVTFYEVVGDKIRGLSDSFSIGGMGFSVATDGKKYAIVSDRYDDTKIGIKILNANGTLNKSVKARKMLPCRRIKEKLFGDPPKLQPYICFDARKDQLYVGEEDKKKLFCLSLKGKPIWEMTFDGFPNGILANDDVVYVATSGDNCVHLIHTDGTYGHVLLTPEDGVEWPGCIAFQKKQKRLLVLNSIHVPRIINVYQLPN